MRQPVAARKSMNGDMAHVIISLPASRVPSGVGRSERRPGIAVVYLMILLVALTGLASFGVDWGRVATVKAELRAAADAAARAGVAQLANGNGAALAAAQTVAVSNAADGRPVVLAATDVEIGVWDPIGRTFAPAPASAGANAVRVTAARTADRGTAVPLSLGSILGMPTCDARVSAVAAVDPPTPPYGIAAVDRFTARGILTLRSYPSGGRADLASNGDITLNLLGLIGITYIDGDCRPGPSGRINKPLLSFLTRITGSSARLSEPLYYPPVDATGFDRNNNNTDLPVSAFDGQDFTALLAVDLPAGTYYVRNLTVLAGVIVRVRGPVTFYVTGNVTLAGSIVIDSGRAKDFKVRVAGPGTVNLLANVAMVMDLYAPESAVFITAGVGYWGGLVGKTIDILATSFIHYDETLGPPGGGVRKIRLVK